MNCVAISEICVAITIICVANCNAILNKLLPVCIENMIYAEHLSCYIFFL